MSDDVVVSEVEASERLSELVDRALAGEAVRIERDGAAVVEFKTIIPNARSERPERRLTHIDLQWLRAHRVGDRRRVQEDAGEAVRRMRDEDWA